MFCPNCGHQIEGASAKFCHNCGFDLSQITNKQPSDLRKLTESSFHQTPKDSKTIDSSTPKHAESPKSSEPVYSTPVRPNPSWPEGTDSSAKSIPHIRETSYDNESWWSRFNGKWGWGWAILGWLYINPTATKNLTRVMDDDSVRILQLFGVVVSLSLYFLFRQKILLRVQKRWLRSFLSGIIAFTLTFLANTAVSEFLPLHGSGTQSSQPQPLDRNVSNILDTELSQLKSYLTTFAKKDKALWERLTSEPNSKQEIRSNISLLDQLIPLYQQKDSIMPATYQKIVDAFESSPSWKTKAPQLVNDFRSIVNKGKLLAVANRNMLSDLRLYYLSLDKSDGLHNELWKSYETSEARVQQLSQELSPILLRITGKNLDQTKQDLLEKYYK